MARSRKLSFLDSLTARIRRTLLASSSFWPATAVPLCSCIQIGCQVICRGPSNGWSDGEFLPRFNHLFRAFDDQLRILSAEFDNIAGRRFVETTAKSQRDALERYLQQHGKLPATVNELARSGVGVPKFRGFTPFLEAIGAIYDTPVDDFLRVTADAADQRRPYPGAGKGTIMALVLVHAVYRAWESPVAWREAATILSHRGFSDEQIELLRTDDNIRRAVRRLKDPA
jgi:hypothetical protein